MVVAHVTHYVALLALACFAVTVYGDAGRVHQEAHVLEEIVISGRAVPLLGSAT